MDNYRNKDIMENVIKTNERINALEEMIEYLQGVRKGLRTRCNHEMIFINLTLDTKAYGNVCVGNCIICGNRLYLRPQYYHNARPTEKLYYRDVDSGHDYPEDNVLNIINSEFVDEYGELFEIAHNTYKEMLEKDYYLYKEDEIKNEIIKNFKSKIKKKIK